MAPDEKRPPQTLEDVPNEVMNKIVALVASLPKEDESEDGSTVSSGDRTCIQDLKALSLTNSRFLPACREYIFQRVSFSLAFDARDSDQGSPEASLCVLEKSPYLAPHVRALVIMTKTGLLRGNVDLKEEKLEEMERYLSLIKNLRELTVLTLTRMNFPHRVRLMDALRSLVLSNPHIEKLSIADTVYFPMDIILCIPKLVYLRISELRTQEHIIHGLHGKLRIPLLISIVQGVRRVTGAAKHIQLPDTFVRPVDGTAPVLKKLDLEYIHVSDADSSKNILSWASKNFTALDLSAVSTLTIPVSVLNELRSGWRLIMKCSDSLESLTIITQDTQMSTYKHAKPFNLSLLPKLSVLRLCHRMYSGYGDIRRWMAWCMAIASTADQTKCLEGSLFIMCSMYCVGSSDQPNPSHYIYDARYGTMSSIQARDLH